MYLRFEWKDREVIFTISRKIKSEGMVQLLYLNIKPGYGFGLKKKDAVHAN